MDAASHMLACSKLIKIRFKQSYLERVILAVDLSKYNCIYHLLIYILGFKFKDRLNTALKISRPFTITLSEPCLSLFALACSTNDAKLMDYSFLRTQDAFRVGLKYSRR